MTLTRLSLIVCFAVGLSACEEGVSDQVGEDKGFDRGVDEKDLSQLVAGIWVDPNGCDHWIIDDGLEGYLSARLDKFGKPVCSGVAPPTTVVGDYQSGGSSIIGDPL